MPQKEHPEIGVINIVSFASSAKQNEAIPDIYASLNPSGIATLAFSKLAKDIIYTGGMK